MSLKIPQPGQRWDQQYQIRANQAVEAADVLNRKVGTDVEIGAAKLIIKSPNGARWAITVSNAGVVAATAL